MITKLRRDAQNIWQAGVDAVRPERLVPKWLKVEGRTLSAGNERIDLETIRRIAVVGGGKAAAGMAAAVETVLGPELMAEKQLAGWVNVPADCIDAPGTICSRLAAAGTAACVSAGPTCRRTINIHLHAARPAGANEPTAEGVAGTQEILRLVGSLGPDDLCLCLISGGGSALLPNPAEGITLADKLAVTRHLSAAGANIEQLNTVRKQLSLFKGGGLLRACRAGRLVSLVISDVLGDRLDLIASGPTVPDNSTPNEAIGILERFGARAAGVSPSVFAYLERQIRNNSRKQTAPGGKTDNSSTFRELLAPGYCVEDGTLDRQALNLVIGNNAAAVEAAAVEARRLGYDVIAESATQSEGPAEEVGRRLAEAAIGMRGAGPKCLISGGEPVVKLVEPTRRGLGGRNQQLALAALVRLAEYNARDIVLLAGGTDGEDGPTDAAGAFVDADVIAAARRANLDPAGHLARNDAYNFFDPLGALLRTGPTGTNVCDLRVALIA